MEAKFAQSPFSLSSSTLRIRESLGVGSQGSKEASALRGELYNEQMNSQGSTVGFITWTIQKGGGGSSWL
jgi:hypothetical protein